jgi:hypothetical protein
MTSFADYGSPPSLLPFAPTEGLLVPSSARPMHMKLQRLASAAPMSTSAAAGIEAISAASSAQRRREEHEAGPCIFSTALANYQALAPPI